MPEHGIAEVVAFAAAALAVVVVVRFVAERIRMPFTVLLVLVGGLYALLPGPNIALEPDVVLTAVIAPLLYSAALGASLIDIRRAFQPIASLSLGLVLATALVLGALLPLVVPHLGFAAAVALGAAVAPPDPVAALSIGRRVGLPRRLLTVIEGEGLLNDATALTVFGVAVAAVAGSGFSLGLAVGDFLLSAVGGVVIGAGIALLLGMIRPLREDAVAGAAVSLATPFVVYIVGEELHVSGVLAVVIAGLVAGHRLPRSDTGASRLQAAAVWRVLDLLLEGFVFLLLGNQLPEIVPALSRYSAGTLVGAVLVTLAVALLLRPIWLALTQLLPRRLRLAGDRGAPRLTAGELVLLSWSGTRGAITLAAVYSLPLDFPQRDLLLFCAFVLVAVTLLGQGLTFAPLARRLGIRASAADGIRSRNEARLAAVDAALARLDDVQEVPEEARAGLLRDLEERRRRYGRRLEVLSEAEEGEPQVSSDYLAALGARRAILQAERDELLRRRDEGMLSEPDLRRLQGELDHQESQLPPIP
ncbi:sodium:proton antiporter [Amnibacterium sp. CER49]|uniref:cation:proton antiporter n=1 Tax=Amnibacterium sp. CER49 TaxID=3039161 RepID=UPI00244AC267|nr:sodium:proton antiporter [Amnibacterium sp. CER49]MDH2445466.1 sodium:proton antiporter [Amnibacterium sp. CER49]